MMQKFTQAARALRHDVVALWFALRHPRTPWLAKVLIFLVTTYALSPIDLIPDFVPVLGYVDDLLIVPAGAWLALRLVPPDVVAECRAQADAWFAARKAKPRSYLGLALMLVIWLALAAWAVRIAGRWIR